MSVTGIIALEEHFWTPGIRDALIAQNDETVALAQRWPAIDERLGELGDERLHRMDQAGVEMQVLSVSTPGTQNLTAAQAVGLAQEANDLAADAVRRHPDRFAAFATLPTPDPEAAASELRRAVIELGMVGAMIFPRTGDLRLDHPSLRVVFEAAAQLGAPLYIHPQFPPRAIRDSAYSGFAPAVNEMLASGGWGWHAEAGLAALRLILAGTFDRHPDLQIILGHWGEMLLGYLDRVDVLSGVATDLDRSVAEIVTANTLVTPGGVYSRRMMATAVAVLGTDRIMMATDDPYQRRDTDGEAAAFVDGAPLQPRERAGFAHANAQRILLREPAGNTGTDAARTLNRSEGPE